ncbi:MAG: hypothetical protein IT341_10515 [Chloroflexi bacterium]|nr:hypothetical protein [Chloroflexota bacterium]
MTERTTLAVELQAVMATRGATEWSKILDVDRTTVHKWWSGDAYPRGRQLEAIAREVGMRLRFVPDAAEDAPTWARQLTEEVKREIRRVALGPDELPDGQSIVDLVIARLEAQRGPDGQLGDE